jgi:hypothetical protein
MSDPADPYVDCRGDRPDERNREWRSNYAFVDE